MSRPHFDRKEYAARIVKTRNAVAACDIELRFSPTRPTWRG